MTQILFRTLLTLTFLAISLTAWGETTVFQVAPDLALELTLPGSHWVAKAQPPEFLVEERVEHAAHEIEHQGNQVPSAEQLLAMVRRQLSGNEIYVYNPDTRAHLEIDFSPLNKGESPPGEKSLASSARYAGQSLESEEGVSDLRFRTEKADFPWAKTAYRLEADYLFHGEKRRFLGIIGFIRDNWVFLYYTDPLARGDDFQEMEAILSGLNLR